MVVRYHGRVWYYCWQRECIVRYIPPAAAFESCTKEEAVTSTANRDDGSTAVVLEISSRSATGDDSTGVEVAVSDDYVQSPSCSNGRFVPQEVSSQEMTKVMDEIRILHICVDDEVVVPQAIHGETSSKVEVTILSDVGHPSCSTDGASISTTPHTNSQTNSDHHVQNIDKYNGQDLYFFVLM